MNRLCLVATIIGIVVGHRLREYGAFRLAPRPYRSVYKPPLRTTWFVGIDESSKLREIDESRDGDVQRVSSTVIPTHNGPLNLTAFQSRIGDILVAITDIGDGVGVPVRVHDACLTGEVFGSLKCDCGLQLQLALQEQRRLKRGVLIYMPQEGRGIGLANKIAAYHLQETRGLDSVDANLALGLPSDCRVYDPIREILKDLGIRSIVLMTNNPRKVEKLRGCGVEVEGVMPLLSEEIGPEQRRYLDTMRNRMGHMLPELLNNDGTSSPNPLDLSEDGEG